MHRTVKETNVSILFLMYLVFLLTCPLPLSNFPCVLYKRIKLFISKCKEVVSYIQSQSVLICGCETSREWFKAAQLPECYIIVQATDPIDKDMWGLRLEIRHKYSIISYFYVPLLTTAKTQKFCMCRDIKNSFSSVL